MDPRIELTNGTYGVRAVLKSTWDKRMVLYLKSHDVVELELNMAKGWSGNDLSFLCHLPELQAFEILQFGIRNVDPIHALSKLRLLNVTTYCLTEIRFAEFPLLEDCVLEWRARAKSLFECTTLKKLFVNRYKGTDSNGFGNLTNLVVLGILNSPIRDINGLIRLTKLERLRLGNMSRLTSLAGLDNLVNLEELWLQGCRKIGSLEDLRRCSHIKRLYFDDSGEIESLRPLESLPGLEVVSFIGTKIIDGDLSPLKRLRNLTGFAFGYRRHYTHRQEDFGFAHQNYLSARYSHGFRSHPGPAWRVPVTPADTVSNSRRFRANASISQIPRTPYPTSRACGASRGAQVETTQMLKVGGESNGARAAHPNPSVRSSTGLRLHMRIPTLNCDAFVTPESAPSRATRRILFASMHSIVDFSNGASVATADVLRGLCATGFECQAFCTPKLDLPQETCLEQIVDDSGETYDAVPRFAAPSVHGRSTRVRALSRLP
jgi:hypothetical protein